MRGLFTYDDNGKIGNISLSCSTTSVRDTTIYNRDIISYTLGNGNRDMLSIIDNRVGNNGVTTLYVDTNSDVGSRWEVYVIYGENGSVTDTLPPYTSLVVTYGANGQTIDALQNIADFQTIVEVPPTSDVRLSQGNIDIHDGVNELVGVPTRFLYISTITKDSTYTPPSPPDPNSIALGVPTLSNYGVAISLIKIVYLSSTPNPTFLYNVENTYYPVLNE